MRVVLLGSPGHPGEALERWHDDVYLGALQLGWDVSFLRAKDVDTSTIVRTATGADLLIWMRTHDYNIKGDDGRVMLRRVEDAGVTTVGMHFDLYWGIPSRESRIGREPWWSARYVFTADGGARDWKSRGVNHRWCPPGFGTRFLGYGTEKRHLKKHAVFVGSVIPSIHSRHRQQMLSWAQRQWGRGFQHVGRSRGSRLYGSDLNDLYASTTVVLGDSAPAPYYWSDRLPRTLGRGALLAYPDTAGLDEWGFTNDVMIRFPPGQFRHIAARLRELSLPQRERMTDAAISLIQKRHLWRHRLEHIRDVIFHGARDYRGGRIATQMGQLPGRT